MTLLTLQGAIELGIIYAIMALGVFISFRTLNIPDLTVDNSFVLGAAISAVMCTNGEPIWALPVAMIGGGIAGSVTALLHTKLKIQALLASILVMLALYSVNLRVMGGRANIPLLNTGTVFDLFEGTALEAYSLWLIPGLILIAVILFLWYFLKTRLGFVLRATGDNDQMVRAMGVNTDFTIIIGLAIANGLVGLSGALLAQYQSFADISMGVGMIIIGLASVIIGEVVFGTSLLIRRLIAVILGAVLYRFVLTIAFQLGMPSMDLKLVSAVIVTIFLATPVVKERMLFLKKKRAIIKCNREEREQC